MEQRLRLSRYPCSWTPELPFRVNSLEVKMVIPTQVQSLLTLRLTRLMPLLKNVRTCYRTRRLASNRGADLQSGSKTPSARLRDSQTSEGVQTGDSRAHAVATVRNHLSVAGAYGRVRVRGPDEVNRPESSLGLSSFSAAELSVPFVVGTLQDFHARCQNPRKISQG